MNLHGFGFQEMVLVLVIALLVFGPTKLPRLLKGLGQFRNESREPEDDEGFSPVLIFLFRLLLALTFVYGFFNTIEIFR